MRLPRAKSSAARPRGTTRVNAPVLVFVTDPRWTLERTIAIVRSAASASGPNGLLVQVRDKESPERRAKWAPALRDVTRSERALLVVNGDIALALAVDADGAHVPSHDVAAARAVLGADAFVTTPAHDDDDVRKAVAARASAVLVSPIFATPGKGAARGPSAVANARVIASGALRVYALGGIDASCVAACAGAGADGVAVIRALYDAQDPTAEASSLVAPFRL